jgi:hypothetical protein
MTPDERQLRRRESKAKWLAKVPLDERRRYARERATKWRAANPEKHRENVRKWSAANRELIRSRQRKSQHIRVAQSRDRRLGIGAHSHFVAQVKVQGNCCAICFRELAKPCLDHDHKTGRWRGALCMNCNRFLGYAHDNTGTLRKAIEYLRKWRQKA